MNLLHRTRSRAAHFALATLAVAVTGRTAAAQSRDFEGVITLDLKSPEGTPSSAQYMMKDGKVRMETGGKGGLPAVLLFDPASRMVRVVITPQRIYMERTLSDGDVEQAATKVRPSIERTGKTETVAGRECEHWNITDQGERYDVCVAKGFGTFFHGQNAFGGAGPAWLKELEGGAFPLKVVRADGTTMLQATSIEKKALDASLFDVPAGFKKLDLPAGLMRRTK